MAANLHIPRCAHCDEPLPERGGRGRARTYCSDACRLAAWRARRAAAEFATWQPRAALTPVTWERIEQPERSPVRVSGVPTDEQVARTILEAHAVAGAFLTLGSEARPKLAWRCEKAGGEILDVIEHYFGKVD